MARSAEALGWWQHRTGVASSPAMRRAMRTGGLAVAGAYLAIADLLAQEPTHRMRSDVAEVAWMLSISEAECEAHLDALVKAGMLKSSGGCITCPEIDATVALVDRKSAHGRKAAQARWSSTCGDDA